MVKNLVQVIYIGLFFALGVALIIVPFTGLILITDPLLFFRTTASNNQPFFNHEPEGNFSRFVFPGLISNLPYDTLWVGPSYAAPFARGADPFRELIVTMGNMSAAEQLDILMMEQHLHKAKTVNIILSPAHFTKGFAPGIEATFPKDLWGPYRVFRYLISPVAFRLALEEIHKSSLFTARRELNSRNLRIQINSAYFWMFDDTMQIKKYWKDYGQYQFTIDSIHQLRKVLSEQKNSEIKILTSQEKELINNFCEGIASLSKTACVNIIFPPRYIAAFGVPIEDFNKVLEIKRQILLRTSNMKKVVQYDYETDPRFCFDRAKFYDLGHFSEAPVKLLRLEINNRHGHKENMDAAFSWFLTLSDDELLKKYFQ